MVTRDSTEPGSNVTIEGGEELQGLTLTKTWCWYDAENNEYVAYEDPDFAPVDAGVYYLRLSLDNKSYTVVGGAAYVRAEIRMSSLVVESPSLVTGAQFSANTTVANALNKIESWNVSVSEGDISGELNKDTFWGLYPNAAENGTTRYYQPIYAIQRGVVKKETEGRETTSTTIWDPDAVFYPGDTDTRLIRGYTNDKTKEFVEYAYRIIFTGKKGVFKADGTVFGGGVDINASQKNYTVNTSQEMIERAAREITLSPALLAIKVDGILEKNNEGGKAGTFADPIQKT